jgi:3-hydroxyisobutyrate dehydrogenase-like beta-hydroxyacid dehydrogenase
MGAGGLLSAPALPRVIVDCSTVSGEASSLVRAATTARGVDFIGAPISGNPTVVESGGASMVASGPALAFELVRPYLLEIAKVAVFAGEEEQSRLVKLATNLYLGVMVQALAEVTTLVEKGGTDRAAFLEFLNGTVMGSDWVRRRTPDLIKLDWTPIFPHELMRKDFDLGLGTARDLEVPMPVVAMVHQLLQTAIGRGLGGQDFLSLYIQQAEVAGLQPEPG